MNRTPEMIAADEEIEREFRFTLDELRETRERDGTAADERMDERERKRKEHTRAYNKRYYAEHKAELNAKNRTYYAAHRERENARSVAWRRGNKDYCDAYQRAYYDENRAIICIKKQSDYAVKCALRRLLEAEEEDRGDQA